VTPDSSHVNVDYLVIGAGCVGMRIAIELKRRFPDCSVLIIEKEPSIGVHSSGRNSGVLHAGFYYTADSLKAAFCIEGNRSLTQYCEEHSLPINRCGKLVVAGNPEELTGLDFLLARGRENHVDLQEIDERSAKEIEPRVIVHEKALFSPTTSTVDPLKVMQAYVREAVDLGISIRLSERFLSAEVKSNRVKTKNGWIEAGYIVNTAGLYADRIARQFGFADKLAILPFKGLFLRSDELSGSVRTNVYPVPNLANPFLGVHITVTVDGRFKIGPTAIPCLWREQYGWCDHFRFSELTEVGRVEIPLLFRGGFDFRSLAFQEIRKYWRPNIVRQAAKLITGIENSGFKTWVKPGIRAQLVDTRTRKLLTDFHFEGDQRSLHILNAVSPAFTCAIPFASYVCDRIDTML
jgi:L-2-hydroxyglutarate oxidase LhgO